MQLPQIAAFLGLGLIVCTPALAAAQTRPQPALEILGGYTGFDGGTIDHITAGVRPRLWLRHRLALSPELLLMVGPDVDRDAVLGANATFDLLRAGARPALPVPYVIFGASVLWHWGAPVPEPPVIAPLLYWGGGARFDVRPWLYLAPEFRMGIEPHMQVTASIGIRRRR